VTPRESEEYRALRSTIASRGTTRTWILVAGLASWGALHVATTALMATPLDLLVPFVVLVATFEAVFALHVGVERIGRYLQVFHEGPDEPARWETVAMSFGAPPAGTATDPLFVACFGLAAALNFLPVLFVSAVPAEITVIGLAHALFAARLISARRAAARQRAADLARFREMKDN
jgi:hypothetical protein